MSLTIAIGPFLIQKSLLFTVIGLLIGVIWLRWNSTLSRDIQKEVLEQLMNVLFYFIIALLVAKIIVLRKFLFTFPTAIFVFPANKHIFYLAVVLALIYVLYKRIFNGVHKKEILFALFQVFVVAQFVQSFLMYAFLKNNDYFLPMTILALLLLYMQFNVFNQTFNQLVVTVYFSWITTNLFFNWKSGWPFFLYFVDEWFWLIILLISIGLSFYIRSKQLRKT